MLLGINLKFNFKGDGFAHAYGCVCVRRISVCLFRIVVPTH